MGDVILKVNGLSKYYAQVKALDNISMEIRRGETHALCGENGAGKSTFIKLLTGAIPPSSGTVEFENQVYDRLTPSLAMKLGIAVIYQEFSLVPYLTVAENIFYGREIAKMGVRSVRQMNLEAEKFCREMGVDIDVKAKVCGLGVAYQQIVEILKAVSKNAKFIIMDEPTAPLTLKETEIFFRIIRKLKEKKVTIIFISHRLTEVFDLCERVTVFCDGRFVTTKETGEVTKKQLISYMVGRELADDYPAGNGKTGNVVLEARHITGKRVHDVSCEVREGEGLGIGGLVGAGRTELARAVYGADPVLSGEFLLDAKRFVPKSPRTALEHGIGLIPEDRKKQGLILDATVKENSALSILRRCSDFGVINKKEEERTVHRYIKDLNIKTPGMNQLVKNLSGGNQQKVVLAKMLATNCKILIFDEPTRGIDVGAKQEIYHLIREMTDQGKAVIMISSEMPELIGMSDRILVMADGRLKGEIGRGDFTQEHILEMASDLD